MSEVFDWRRLWVLGLLTVGLFVGTLVVAFASYAISAGSADPADVCSTTGGGGAVIVAGPISTPVCISGTTSRGSVNLISWILGSDGGGGGDDSGIGRGGAASFDAVRELAAGDKGER